MVNREIATKKLHRRQPGTARHVAVSLIFRFGGRQYGLGYAASSRREAKGRNSSRQATIELIEAKLNSRKLARQKYVAETL